MLIQRSCNQGCFTGSFKCRQQGLFLNAEMGFKLGMETPDDAPPLGLRRTFITVARLTGTARKHQSGVMVA
ncbi:MAG: hypothetical protein WAL92_08990 [Thiogranum sp.]